MINNNNLSYNINSYKASSKKFETQFLNLDKSNNTHMDNDNIIINKSLPLPLNKINIKNQNNIINIPKNSEINQINSQQNFENINLNKALNPTVNLTNNQNNNNINISRSGIPQQISNQLKGNIINQTNTNNNSIISQTVPNNNINIQNTNSINKIEQNQSKNINNNISNKNSIKDPNDSKKEENPNPQSIKNPPSKEKFSLKKFIFHPNSTLMGKEVPKAMPVYNFINKGSGISQTEEQGIVFCAMTVYQEEMKPISNNTAKYIKFKLGGDWLVMVYPEGKPIDYHMTLISRNDFIYFTLDTTAYQVCRLR